MERRQRRSRGDRLLRDDARRRGLDRSELPAGRRAAGRCARRRRAAERPSRSPGASDMTDATTPLFTSDLTGLVKFLAILVSVVLVPAATLIVVFLKRTDTARSQKMEDALNGLGERVNRVEKDNTRLQE